MSAATDPRPQGGAFYFSSHASSDRGRARPGNEDAFYRGVTVFAVADGMGGHQAGEVASETAVAPLAALDGREWTSADEADTALAAAVQHANTDVVEQATTNPEWRGMGTTLTAVLVRDGRLHVAHVGDSRAYLYRPGQGMSQLTTDHTLVEQLVREGRISRDEIPTHPQRSVITRAIGVESDVEVDTLAPLQLAPGDQVLLCSDGLSGPVEDAEIEHILGTHDDGDATCDALVRAANRAGGPDNITVVLLRVGDPWDGEVRRRAGTVVTDDDPTPDPRQQTAELDAVVPSGVRRISTATTSDRQFDPQQLGRYGADRAGTGRESRGRGVVRALGWTLGVLMVLCAVGAGSYVALSRSWFVGVDDGEVAIFRGLPQEVGGAALSRVVQRTGLLVEDLPANRVGPLEDGIGVAGLAAAEARVDSLRDAAEAQADAAEQPTRPAPASSPSPPATAPEPFQPEPFQPEPFQPTPLAT